MQTALALKSSVATDPGTSQTINGDTLGVREPANALERVQSGSIWVIADGVGSEASGLRASRLAAQSVVDAYWYSAIPDPASRLRAAVERANSLLYSQNSPEVAGGSLSGATVLAGVVVANRLHLAHVGRSRAYLLRAGVLRQLTDDHSWVAEQIRAGRLTPAEAVNHPRQNVITRCLGIKESVRIDSIDLDLEPGDLVVLCSDGLYRDVGDNRMAVILGRYGADATGVLVDEAKRLGGSDNITVVTVGVSGEPLREASTVERMAVLTRLGRELTMNLDLNATLESVLRQLLHISGGERAAILLKEPEGRLAPRVVHNMRPSGDPLSQSVAQEALRERRPILIANALDDPRFMRAESIVDLGLRSILCVPMIVTDSAVGVLYVDSSTTAVTFTQTDLDLLVSFASQAAAAIQNARLHQELLERTREVEEARRRQNALIRSLSSALIATDEHDEVIEWNPMAEEIFGVPPRDAIGSPLSHVLPGSVGSWLMGLGMQVEGGNQTILAGNQWEGPLGERLRVILAARAARIRDADNQVSGVVFIVNDRTDIVLMEEARHAEAAAREQLRDLFSRYVAPPVVEQLLRAPDSVQLGGSRKDVTILFADVRGFTGFSEQHQPEEVVAMLNRYLALATQEIFAEFGTLDKFLGDGVMAIFGAPLPLENHALAALRAAIGMRSRLDELRRDTGIRAGFGIGLNSGAAIVGNIGTPELMSYTVIGDVVNVSARLQAEARSGEILVSEPTLKLVAGHVEVEELGPLYVKGRAVPVTTYKVIRLID